MKYKHTVLYTKEDLIYFKEQKGYKK